MSRVKMKIWGRILSLNVIYDCYRDEEVLDSQRQALNDFVKNEEIIDDALSDVVQYCLEEEQLNGQDEIDNIFKFIMPKSIYVKRKNRDQEIVLLCDYKLDYEHGMAIIFQNGKLKEIGEQGIV